MTGKEAGFINEAIAAASLGGDGMFSKKCAEELKRLTGSTIFLTPSGTQALELALMALGLQAGDEVILPSYTFVSCGNAIVQMGLIPVFVDVRADTLNLDEKLIEAALSDRTKAIMVVHYAGIGAEMDAILKIARKHSLAVIEDAAQGINGFYKDRHLGSLGDLGILSFHHTKNITSGEGGALLVNNDKYLKSVEIHRQKGTDRSSFLRGEIAKYSWVDRGSSYWMSDLLAAFLYPQLEVVDDVLQKRKAVFDFYVDALKPLADKHFALPAMPAGCRPSYHSFHLIFNDRNILEKLRLFLAAKNIEATTHFLPLHSSEGGKKFGVSRGSLPVSEKAGGHLLRLPLFAQLTEDEKNRVVTGVHDFFKGAR